MKNMLSLALLMIGLTACASGAPAPDYRVKVMVTPDGHAAALPPECPSWSGSDFDSFSNQHWAQYGCANARNLAAMVEDPKDLIDPKTSEAADGATAATAVDLYRTGKTKPLPTTGASQTTVGQ